MIHQHKILLVEDSHTQAINLIDLLEREGWKVAWAPTVEEALETLNQGWPDLILLDYYLPGLRGDELCRRIRMTLPARGISILMLTMDDTHEAELRGLESGADDFVAKSDDPAILLARVRSLLNKSGTPSPFPALADQRFHRARLLTIDDSATYQQYLSTELEQEGYLIERAMSGEAGLERILQEPFDCVLVDLVMPQMSGIEVCQRVSALRQTTDNAVALLMLTGRESKEDLTQALEAGADDFVGKSSDMAVLKGRIRALLRRKFCEEDNRRVAEELKGKEVELLRARTEKELAEARAALNDELEQRVIERTAQLAEANRNLSQQTQDNEMLVYSVSHDLRSPLVNLQGFSHELGEAVQELRSLLASGNLSTEARAGGVVLLDEKITECVHFIQTAVLRLSKIIDAVLRLSRVGRLEYQWQGVHLGEVVRRVIDAMQHAASQRDATITIDELPCVWGDPTAIENIFANLIGNALTYLDPLRPGLIHIGCQPASHETSPDRALELRTYFVTDNGLGVPSDHQSKLFRAFQRLHPTVAPGEGIGLATVRRTVECHGGRIWVESTVGVGSTFYVALPSVAEPGASGENLADHVAGHVG